MPLRSAFAGWLEIEDADQIEFIWRHAIRIAFVSIAIAVALGALFWGRGDDLAITIWLALFVVCRAAGVLVAKAYAQAVHVGKPSAALTTITITVAFLQALAWGCSGFVLMNPSDFLSESVLHMTLTVVVFGSLSVLARYLPLLAAYAVGVFLPLTIRNLMIGDLHHNVLAVLCLIGFVYTLVSGSGTAATLKETYRRRRENAQLIEALQRENQATRQARLQAEQANAAKSRFFAAANHDLRQPLHAVALLAQTLRVHGRKVDVDEVSARIIECVDSLGRIVDELLELSRLDAGKVTPQPATFHLNELVAEVAKTYQPMAQAKGLQLAIDSAHVPVLADRALVARVLSNLISNAVRYTQQGEIKVVTRQMQGSVQIMVQDTGVGIAAHDLTRIFDEFYQVGNPARDRRQGLGLGLATVKRLSDLLDLQIQVRSAVGRGSEFEFCVPVSDLPVKAAAIAPVDSQDLLTGKRILVIEDDASSRDAMHRLLTAWGCSVAAAAGESEVHALLAAGFVPEFVLADMRLGGGTNGSQVIKGLRARFGMSLPALVVTGDGGTGLALGTDRQKITVMRKPVNPMRLRAYLGDAFAHAR